MAGESQLIELESAVGSGAILYRQAKSARWTCMQEQTSIKEGQGRSTPDPCSVHFQLRRDDHLCPSTRSCLSLSRFLICCQLYVCFTRRRQRTRPCNSLIVLPTSWPITQQAMAAHTSAFSLYQTVDARGSTSGELAACQAPVPATRIFTLFRCDAVHTNRETS